MCLLVVNQAKGHGLTFHEFKSLDHRIGMNAGAVYCFIQDNQGLIWLGTDRGLFSFDGYSARKHIASSSIAKDNGGVIYCAEKVDSAHIWLGADNGLLVFNTYTDQFEKAPAGLPMNIRAIERIDDRSFWIGSINGLYRYDVRSNRCEKITDRLPHQAVYSILRYDENTFYFGTYNGLCKYDNRTSRFTTIPIGDPGRSSNQLILSMLPDYKRNCLWIGVEGGLYSFDPSGIKPRKVLFHGNSVKSLMLDNMDCLWAGTDNGLFIYEPSTGKHRLIRHDASNDKSLINNVIWTVFTDREQNIWIGTDAGASLFMYNDQFRINPVSELTGSNEGDYIISLLQDSKGNLWLGGTNGLIHVDKQKNRTAWYQQNSKKYAIPHNKVRHIFEDADGDIWIATDGSVCRFDEKTAQFVRYQIEDSTGSRNANWSYAIAQDETRKLWIATCLGGIFVVDKQSLLASSGKRYIAERNYYSGNQEKGLSGNMIQFLSFDRDLNIWAGTYRAGINKINRLSQQITWFTAQPGEYHLPSDDVTAMLTDRDKYLWIALRDQVIRLDPHNNSRRIITDPRLNDAYIHAMADDGQRIWLGLSSGLFFIDKRTLHIGQLDLAGNYYSSLYYDKANNIIIAGGINEYAEFNPETILNNNRENNLYITSMWINDRLVQNNSGNDFPRLTNSIRFTRQVRLLHQMNNLSFEVSELSYNRQQNVQYAYRLSQSESEWHYTPRGSNRITYNNLVPGEYMLEVSGIGSDGNPLPDPPFMAITILQPWFLTWPLKTVYVLVIIILIAASINYYRVLSRLRYERIEKSKTMELTAHKIDFLTNISHELKTPLSLIIGPLENIIDQVKQVTIKEQLSDVRHNAIKMGTLIHQLMEASRQEFDGFGLIVSRTDLIPFIESVISVYKKTLEDRSVRIQLVTDLPSVYIEVDVMKLEVILNNILSNAVKFAPDNSDITVNMVNNGEKIIISVEDKGPGIEARDLPHIFERFYKSHNHHHRNIDGSGVGLSIVKEYVQLHRGTVTVFSDGMSGTRVDVELPVRQMVGDSAARETLMRAVPDKPGFLPQLLIVEDNAEILSFISKSLSNQFRCITAQNGKQGLEAAQTNLPDIIVTDIMMPVMDGIEMCRRLRENVVTSMIPVVMLTARDDKNTEIMGYRTGVDAFIAKPFEIGYLSDRLHHLLMGRNHLVKKARQEAILKPKEQDVISTDEKLLSVITQIIEKEITNPDLNVQVLAEKSGYSSKHLYRRIKLLTGQTVVDYIRSVRLKTAAMLLSQKRFTVAEVMYMVGFTNHSYFSKRFQEKFGKSPREYVENC